MDRAKEEVELLKTAYPALESVEESDFIWVRIPSYPVPYRLWGRRNLEIAFRVPKQPGEAPYAFWVKPNLISANRPSIANYSHPSSTPFEGEWGQFSWSPLTTWIIKNDIREGSNMLNFARSFADRFKEGAL